MSWLGLVWDLKPVPALRMRAGTSPESDNENRRHRQRHRRPGRRLAAVARRTKSCCSRSEGRLGGHTHTHRVGSRAGRTRSTRGFIVHNPMNYPLLTRLFDELGVAIAADHDGLLGAGRALRAGVQRHQPQRACSASAATCCRRDSGAWCARSCASIANAPPCCTSRRLGPTLGEYLRRQWLLGRCSSKTTWCRWRRRCGLRPRRRSWISRPSTWSRFMDNHHMLQVDRPAGSGAWSRRLVDATSSALQRDWDVTGAAGGAGAARLARCRRCRCGHRRTARSASTRWCSPATATRRCACWPMPRRPNARCWARSPTRTTKPCCTPTRASCRADARPGRRGMPTFRRSRAPPARSATA